VRGWECVVSGLAPEALDRARGSATLRRSKPLGAGRHALEFPLTTTPEEVLREVAAMGASIVSLNPVHDTLEDFFVRQVAAARVDRGLEPLPS
jgi:hypothetical protein